MILVDPPIWPAHGRRWSHVVSDTSLRELHAFAAALGIPERAFEGDHYDVPEERYAQTVLAGAIPVSGRELLRRLQASGLRRSKRRGERVVASRQDDGAAQRVDSVLSALPPLGRVNLLHAVILHAGHLLVTADGEGFCLPVAEVGAGPDPIVATARRLARDLLGRGWAGAPARQVGYLRRVPHGQSRPVDFQVVVRWPESGLLVADPWARDPRVEDPRVGDPRVVVLLPAAGRTALPGGEPETEALHWVPVRQAVALLPVDLAPVALPEHHRLRPPGGAESVPFRPEGR